jgi:hypothetical protein
LSEKSESVKRWRKSTKNRIIAAMGGSCVCCGYKKCTAALELHHLDSSEKELSIGTIRASIRSWGRIAEELRKCVLVCSNCHKEIHTGITFVHSNAFKFNENYADYKELDLKTKQHPCPICEVMISEHKKTCSYKCAAKYNRRVNWDMVDLEKICKEKSILKVSELLGVSDATIRKRLKKILESRKT